ncbi:glycosyltransferase family 2 protein [Candidatus Nitrososphaera sp. FF02]|uniref:glycosyltransferase family 2 protein n=1 Tax=Candidatus Nitrososphaera sp. FF02 TaxID=3398226 RepID=UPI0039EBF26C
MKQKNHVTVPAAKSGQKIAKSGRIQVSKKAWVVRMVTMFAISTLVSYTIYLGLELQDALILVSVIFPIQALTALIVGWVLFKTPATGSLGNDLVTVIIPVYNQKEMIGPVIDSIYESTYKNIEVVAVNDGSRDGTKEALDALAAKYSMLKVIHKKNEGKRKAIASGFYNSKGSFVIFIDSDSIVEKDAIEEILKAFKGDARIGAVVGHAKVWNAHRNALTRCQDVWYDNSFNVRKSAESYFGSVLCCSGCLSGYRREAIVHYLPFWAQSKTPIADDREMTTFVVAPHRGKELMAPGTQNMMKWMARYDDAEDRGLTGQALLDWKAVYVPTAVVYTEVPETMRVFLKQQKRWKKGTLRVNFFVSGFFWRRNPIMSFLIFYMEFMHTFINPILIATAFIYEPLVLQNYWVPVFIFFGIVMTGLAQGADYKFRDPTSKYWYYKPFENMLAAFVLCWLLFPAIWSLRKNDWGTR